ncbi:hypothetical protein M011DRAFT_182345 [Sporormia fimetaria CBS 119925]|uniref:Uncharacterized protein n=1 Tax=Sporormia fimetaria CBS 119925 TaxID=1340428 RepID=A0A6A6VLZ3_9PLEO|nr:hypothetical protein M011DRAFT_182345 [Sporormia fimetaria CBS 119925]
MSTYEDRFTMHYESHELAPSNPLGKSVGEYQARVALLMRDREKQQHVTSGEVRRHSNDLIDVRGGPEYEELVQHNAKSPLLSLPPEIRRTIYCFALGGTVFKAVFEAGAGSAPGMCIHAVIILCICGVLKQSLVVRS